MASTPSLNASDTNYFSNLGQQITDQYNLGNAQNEYARSTAQQNYAINNGNLVQQFTQLRNQLPGSFIHRGLINSGLYGQGLADYYNNRDTQLGNLSNQYQNQLQGYTLAGNQLQQNYNTGLANVQTTQAARLADLASLLGQ